MEKLTFETLLPVALELFKNVPKDKPVAGSNREDYLKFSNELADDFASFYHRLRQNLEARGKKV